MIKAVFLDYTGTILQQRGADLDEIIQSVVNGSTLHSKEEVIRWWHQTIRRLKGQYYADEYVSYDDLLTSLTDTARMEIRYKESADKVHESVRNYWMYAPVYDDAREFFDLCVLPVYVLCENRREYVSICLHRNRIHVNGILSSDDVKAYAPHAEFYENALKTADCKADEAVYVSEDYNDCVKGARDVGMHGVLLDRKSMQRNAEGRRIRSLIELLPLIKTENSRKQ